MGMEPVRQVVREVAAAVGAVLRGLWVAVRFIAEAVEALFFLAVVAGVLYLALAIAVRLGAAPSLAPALAWVDTHAVLALAWVRSRKGW